MSVEGELREKGRGNRHGMNGRPEIVYEARQCEFAGSSGSTGHWRAFANFYIQPGLRQDDCCRKSIRSASDNRSAPLHPFDYERVSTFIVRYLLLVAMIRAHRQTSAVLPA
jgi:hypothetical protein